MLFGCRMWVKLVEGNTFHQQCLQNTLLHARSDYSAAFTAWRVLCVYLSHRHFILHLLKLSLRNVISHLRTSMHPPSSVSSSLPIFFFCTLFNSASASGLMSLSAFLFHPRCSSFFFPHTRQACLKSQYSHKKIEILSDYNDLHYCVTPL